MHHFNFKSMSGQHKVSSEAGFCYECRQRKKKQLLIKCNQRAFKNQSLFHPSPVSPAIPTALSPCYIRLGQLTWPAVSSASLSQCALLLENTFFIFQTHSCGLQIARDSIWATEMSRAILELISEWDGTAASWLPCNSCKNHPCQSELLCWGRGFKGSA